MYLNGAGAHVHTRIFSQELEMPGSFFTVKYPGDDRLPEDFSVSGQCGFFDHPRRINSGELAERMGVHKTTLLEHIQKAEKRLIWHILGQVAYDNRLMNLPVMCSTGIAGHSFIHSIWISSRNPLAIR